MKDDSMRRDDRRPLGTEALAELAALAQTPDEMIDLSDMPEVKDWTGAVRGKYYRDIARHVAASGQRIALPEPVARIYQAVEDLERTYDGRRFTPDGHLVGSIGEVVAAEALGLTLYRMGRPGHDARDAEGRDVQIKLTAGSSVAMYADSDRLVVLRIVSPREAEIVYDGPGAPAWEAAGKMGKNGQRVVTLAALRRVAASAA